MRNIIKLACPADDWVKGLPIGNGRLGAMVQGQVEEETLLLNEETMFYGGPRSRHNSDTREYVGKIRKLLWDNKPEEAEFLARAAMTGNPRYISAFQPAGQLRVVYHKHRGQAASYSRTLDLDEALASISYELDGVPFKREYFASFDSNVIAYSVFSPSGAPITLMANLNRRPFEEKSAKIDSKTVALWGRCGADGVEYFGCGRMIAVGGECCVIGDTLVATGADKVFIYVSFGTDYLGNTRYREEAIEALDAAEQKGFDALKAEHTRVYKSLYGRVSLSINETRTQEETTDKLLEKLRQEGCGEYEGARDYLSVLGFNMGRYLLISSSYKCRLPANLQGLWNGSYTPPWESAYTININLQMNYWPAEVCNLAECHEPLFDLLDRIMERGKETAKKLYGCRGFVAHHNTDLWGDTDPDGLFGASPFWVMGGAWLSLHLWEHYLFNQDKEFLKYRAFPVLEQALLFFHDYLCSKDGGGIGKELHTGPSVSPENTYISPDGQRAALCMSPAMDIEILNELFHAYSVASGILNQGKEFLDEMEGMIKRLPCIKLTKDGRIREWLEDYDEKEPRHRHISHLFALHPGTRITDETPELRKAAEKTLTARIENGGGHTGWSGAWVANHWARLRKGNLAGRHILELLRGRTIENMLSVHPPFQIDGNFGLTAGIAEMLIQSHSGYCELLPALPDIWEKGRVNGLRIRGAVTVNLSWNNGKLDQASFLADEDIELKVKYNDRLENVTLKKGVPGGFV
jgi:alpha-L-fucosidase 2